MNNQSVFIVTSTFFKPKNGPMMGTWIEGVFTSLELAEQQLRIVEEREQYSDFIVMSSIRNEILNNTFDLISQ